MTFLEAAIEILRSTEEPLHFNEIARLAVERKLLSHVGRDPEAAMRSCLNSAVRSKIHDSLVMRSKPGHYRLRPGIAVPELPDPPSEAEPLPDALAGSEDPEPSARSAKNPRESNKKARKTSTRTKKKTTRRKVKSKVEEADAEAEASEAEAGEVEASEAEASESAPAKKTRRSRKAKTSKAMSSKGEAEGSEGEGEAQTRLDLDQEGQRDSAEDVEGPEEDQDLDAGSGPVVPNANLDPSKVRFRGPEGSGLEGDTDITLVMANAMSRLVDERPDLKEELEAMQKTQPPSPEVIEVVRKKRRDDERSRDDERNRDDERGGRRRRRRRRRGRRVEWSDASAQREVTRGDELLDRIEKVLRDAGPRSLHVRQIAENLAGQGILGGEISEIERAVTASMLLDVHERGDGSRFAIRGDARYQLRGNRLPEKAAAAEQAMRASIRALERETEAQLLHWIQSLGARSLESLVRIWLAREGFRLLATLPPARGLGKLVAEDPDPEEDDGRTLVLIVPRKTSLEPKLWDGEAERNSCASTLVFSMAEQSDGSQQDARVIFAPGFVQWLLRNGVAVRTLNIRVPVLDADLIESVRGLDT